MNSLPRIRLAHLLALLCAVSLLALAGCGGDDDDDGGGGGDEAAETQTTPQPQTTPDTETTPEEDQGGGGGGEEAAAAQTLQDYIDGVVEGDGAKVCDQFTAEVQQQLEQAGNQGCAEFFDGLLGILSEEQKNQLRDIDVNAQVEVNGDRATAKVPSLEGGGNETVNMQKEGGEWKIAQLDDENASP